MATHTAVPATVSTGDVWTTTLIDGLPGGWIGYNQVTADQTSISNTTDIDLTSLTVTVTVNTSRRILIVGHAWFSQSSGSAGIGSISIKESTTVLTQSNFHLPGTGFGNAPECSVVLTPSAGSHTYKLAAHTNSGSVVMTMAGNSLYPAYILVTDLGPA